MILRCFCGSFTIFFNWTSFPMVCIMDVCACILNTFQAWFHSMARCLSAIWSKQANKLLFGVLGYATVPLPGFVNVYVTYVSINLDVGMMMGITSREETFVLVTPAHLRLRLWLRLRDSASTNSYELARTRFEPKTDRQLLFLQIPDLCNFCV